MNPKQQAEYNKRAGLGLESNPYKQGTPEYEEFMMEMGRLQHEEFKFEMSGAWV